MTWDAVPTYVPADGSGQLSEPLAVCAEDGSLELSPEATVLVVDPDGVTRRVVELSLGPVRGLHVKCASAAAEALELLGRVAVDLVISASRLRDGDGLELRRRSKELRQGRVPFVMLSSDQRPAAKTAALLAGVDDYLVKPCDRGELAARVCSIIARSRRWRVSARTRSASLAGDFATLPLADLVAALELGGYSGHLTISTSRAGAELSVEKGRVVDARYANLAGIEAFARLMEEPSGTFELSREAAFDGEHTIDMSATGLLMEAARLIDERRAAGTAPCPAAAGPAAAARSMVRQPPDAELMRVFEHALTDGWSPGELAVLRRDELVAHTRSGAVRERFHVLLVADLGAGVASMLELAAPPGAATLCAALRGDPCAVVYSAHGRHDRLLDVVLVDLANPAALQAELGRSPALLVVAPPGGDALALTARARVGLAALCAALEPQVILGVGGPALEELVGGLRSERGGALVCCVRGSLGVDARLGEIDLRHVLVEGLRSYAIAGTRQHRTWGT